MRVILWGAGQRLENFMSQIEWDSVDCLIDREYEKKHIVEGKQVLPPEEFRNRSFDYIVISSNLYFEEIASELILRYAVNPLQILSLDFLLSLNEELSIAVQRKTILALMPIFPKNPMGSMSIYYGDRKDFGDTLHVVTSLDCKKTVNVGGILLTDEKEHRPAKIFVVTHKPYFEKNIDGYQTIFAGAKKAENHPYLGDDTGMEISDWNPLINECTALYWIWKNDDSEIVGLAHYRRFLESPCNQGFPVQRWEAEQLLKRYDFLTSEVFCTVERIEENFAATVCNEAYQESWKVVEKIFAEQAEEKKALGDFLNGHTMLKCNLFVTTRPKLEEYCSWLFPKLFRMIQEIPIRDEWDSYSKRIIGFWAERFFTIWMMLTGYSMKELRIIQTE